MIVHNHFDLMTMQPHKFNSIGYKLGTSQFEISWNYINIIPKKNLYIRKLAFLSDAKSQMLPFMDNITIEISGVADPNNITSLDSSWQLLKTINIDSNNSYNDLSSCKEFIQRKITPSNQINEHADNNLNTHLNAILEKTEVTFDLRIYGNNFAEQTPSIDDRSIYFYNLKYDRAMFPSKPEITQINF